MKELTVQIKDSHIKKIKAGSPLLEKDAIQNTKPLTEEGMVLKLVDSQGTFIGRGYYGRQNKGYGWVLSRNEREAIDPLFFLGRIHKAIENRAVFFESNDTTAFRVFNGEGDGIGGLTIDYYDGFYVMTWYSEGIYRFRNWVIEALETAPQFRGLYEKKRFDKKGTYMEDDDYVSGERGEFPLLVKENGLHFAIYLNDGPMVGVFLDQKEVRKKIRDNYSEGKIVLNTFSYTGAFSVAAALGGATKTTSVDLANRSLPKTIEQFSVNGIDYDAQDIKVMDVFQYFKYAKRKELSFDVVILDPPSFARSKKHTFSAQKDYTSLLQEAIQITEDDGVIVASTNCSTFGMKKFKGFIDQAFKKEGFSYKIEETFSLPDDFRTIKAFPEGNYLKVVIVKKVKG
ncbi:class I SAM-dependent rRNA methyltransferase [Alkalihalophilus lindianensis]|uniref:Class I SAM-dependent rRNA methyltransferase n=1 Tax=Alkalihalophilus lindianensis TaxID=1630542 RepID=A0ABU3X9S5_9BACI|nr:class I SAM-dependent rRNA methyltransferase [Alkalihalophilus lindianensis]MDV2684638.1 class I SAM-dependent rRNA methyltransferase [Alkalihalophilus lindianensis]